eukprot:scaffold4002_cov85-Cylindrotheca_fusiformis.AAC.5
MIFGGFCKSSLVIGDVPESTDSLLRRHHGNRDDNVGISPTEEDVIASTRIEVDKLLADSMSQLSVEER